MIPRQMAKKLKQLAESFSVITLLGPRQAGKTTLAKDTFSHYQYISLEDLDNRAFAVSDPRGFLKTYEHGVIIDEVQHAPGLLSYIQTIVDQEQKPGKFILTGSQNFVLNEKISQTLAGRSAILNLWPLSIDELKQVDKCPKDYATLIFQGSYPRIHTNHVLPLDWYPNYIANYVERDVRQIKNVTDLMVFQQFLKLCAGRTGQLLNLSDLGRDCGINYNTAKSWISILAASFIIFLVPPHYQNFSKRLVKSPKLYFCDTGLACSLLGIESEKQVESHYLKGSLFESLVISDFMKHRFNQGRQPNCYFWRDQTGHEIDCILEQGNELFAVEVKSGKTVAQDFFSNLSYWNRLSHQKNDNSFVVYGGDADQRREQARVVNWSKASRIILET